MFIDGHRVSQRNQFGPDNDATIALNTAVPLVFGREHNLPLYTRGFVGDIAYALILAKGVVDNEFKQLAFGGSDQPVVPPRVAPGFQIKDASDFLSLLEPVEYQLEYWQSGNNVNTKEDFANACSFATPSTLVGGPSKPIRMPFAQNRGFDSLFTIASSADALYLHFVFSEIASRVRSFTPSNGFGIFVGLTTSNLNSSNAAGDVNFVRFCGQTDNSLFLFSRSEFLGNEFSAPQILRIFKPLDCSANNLCPVQFQLIPSESGLDFRIGLFKFRDDFFENLTNSTLTAPFDVYMNATLPKFLALAKDVPNALPSSSSDISQMGTTTATIQQSQMASQPETAPTESKTSIGVIVIVIVLAIAGLVVAIFGILFLKKRRERRERQATSPSSTPEVQQVSPNYGKLETSFH